MQIPRCRYIYDDIDMFRKYKRFRPKKLRPAGSNNFIYVDPSENRGRAILRGFAGGQPELKKLWRNAVRTLEPTIVLDVGLNYGEFLFAETYSEKARLIGIEANERLQPWIESSKKDHPNSKQMELICALASDKKSEKHTFYVDPAWSGRSSAVQSAKHKVERREIPSITIDSLFEGRPLNNETLVFKIDVEGYEPFVLRGMQQLIKDCPRAVGLMEFNSQTLQQLEVDIEEFLAFLLEHFQVYMVDHAGHITPIKKADFTLMQEALGTKDVETDLLLISQEGIVSQMQLVLS
jgi:FkbM family methyltransferase